MDIRNVLIIGNRQLSFSILSALLQKSLTDVSTPYHVSVLTYPSQTPWLPPNTPPNLVEHRTSDFSVPSLESSFSGQDMVINTIAGGDYNFQARVIDAAVLAGVKRFVPHEFGHDSLNEAVHERLPRSADRAKVVRYLHDLSRTHLDFEWAAVSVGCILDHVLVAGDLGFDMQWQSVTIHGTGTEPFAVSSLERAGNVVANIIQHWDQVKNRYLYAAGVLTTANDVLACLERSSGKKWSVEYEHVEESIKEGKKRIERGYPDSGMFLLERSVLYDEKLKAVGAFQKRSSNGILRLEPEKIGHIVAKAYHEFKRRGQPGCGCE
ncbi:uncharacterized protein BDR25DRAFT_43189 [Lindgomyces ingoldianus]|uniref:Uncharacterized protein n=1 Tax=Lindgomyces ingoldianus TaxID=673940 RepID=A0ACB6RE78_9PLEO|nr:uncharacterized protein BDR25DRAFT_43189 [Lindgomyces ingoldianus]KAF2477025.1 hypothetical protein BDR25DRAFT_43189 [Lindgomyces ingoldianus]